MPTVSVLLAVHNGLPYLEESIRSIAEQSFGDFELIVVDDGSTDGTADLLAQWRRDDRRLVVLHQVNQGQTPSLNRAIATARGEYLARQDADDVSEPERLARQVERLRGSPELAVLGSATAIIDADGKEIGLHRPPTGVARVRLALWRENVVSHGSVLMRRRALDDVGAYRAAFRYAKDWDLWLRMLQRGRAIDNLPERLYRWRLSPEGAYRRDRARQVKFAGLALAFARERERYGVDSHDRLLAVGDDLEGFAASYRCRGVLYELWGELCLRSLGDRKTARRYLLGAARSGRLTPRLLALTVLSLTIGWPGRAPLSSS